MGIKIINIMPEPPAYGLCWDEPLPDIRWHISNEQWIGIGGFDWLDLIGNEVLKVSAKFEYEVWQPDLRADKIYSHTFSNGSVHRLFPSELKTGFNGIKIVKHIVSQAICETLISECKRHEILLRIGDPSSRINRDILDLDLRCPILTQYFGEFKSPIHDFFVFRKNILSKLTDLSLHFALRRYLDKSDVVTYTAEFSASNLRKYYGGKMISLSIGIDFDYWCRSTCKEKAKYSLGIGRNKFVILSSSRLNSLKQVDMLIDVLSRISDKDFLLVITGHGDEGYERYLHRFAQQDLMNGKFVFTGHITEENLLHYYSAADLFVMSSVSEAGPTSTIKALAMEVPVFTTDTGQMAEVLAKHGAGIIVQRKNYKAWERELHEILCGKKVKILDREIVKKMHHWPYVAKQYIELYNWLFEKYYGNNKEGRCM